MTRFWGDESWRGVAYVESPQYQLFSPPEMIKQSNESIVAAFKNRLKRELPVLSMFQSRLPMKNSKDAVVYYLFFASQKPIAKDIIEDIFGKYR
jgi:hypothetical protein